MGYSIPIPHNFLKLEQMNYAIIAAGEGSRLYNEGFNKPKPMVLLNNETLIERLIRIFTKNNANKITIIINEQSPELKALLEEKNINIPIKIICKSTPSSLHSFYEIIKETEEEIDVVQCVIELWLNENQKKCIEGMAENVLCGI